MEASFEEAGSEILGFDPLGTCGASLNLETLNCAGDMGVYGARPDVDRMFTDFGKSLA